MRSGLRCALWVVVGVLFVAMAGGMRVLCLLLLGTLAYAPPSDEKKKEYEEALANAERQAERTRDPYGDQNMKDAAKFLSTTIRDKKHKGDKAAFFSDLDVDNDGTVSLEEMKAVSDHAKDIHEKQPGGLWNMMHNLLETKSDKGFHGELHDHLDADNDGVVSSSEFHAEL